MTGKYATDTTVSAAASRSEIESTLKRYGGSSFVYGQDDETRRVMVGFRISERNVRFTITLPDPGDRAFTHTPTRDTRRSADKAKEAWEQAVRQIWRALHLIIKAKLEAVAAGVVEFDSEFLAHIVLPDGRTVGQTMLAPVRQALDEHGTPPLLPDYSK